VKNCFFKCCFFKCNLYRYAEGLAAIATTAAVDATFDAAKAIKAYQKQMDATHEKIDDAAKKRRERLTARLAKAPAKLPPMDGAAAHAPGSAVGLYKSNHS
jgi:hypothetical protein